jgi:hypothetical protein
VVVIKPANIIFKFLFFFKNIAPLLSNMTKNNKNYDLTKKVIKKAAKAAFFKV